MTKRHNSADGGRSRGSRRGSFDETWLSWLVKVRVIVITFLLAIGLAITNLTQTNVNKTLFVTAILLWYAIAAVHMLVQAVWREMRTQALLQILTDLGMTTVLIYVTGGIDTSFNFLYPLIIIVASILLSQRWAYVTAALSFVFFGAVLEFSYFDFVHSYSATRPDMKSLQAVLIINLFAYMTIAYLATRLSNRLRRMDVELANKSGALENLQALHENIVNSISGGIITTDLGGRIKVVNAAAELLLERDEDELIGRAVDEFFLDQITSGAYPSREEVRMVTPTGKERIFGVTVTALDVPDRGVIGHVYTLDDLTEIRRLEREVRMRDRLAAVGRLASGIAHEIRNPLSSIAGSVKLLSGLSALNDDQRMLVDIVTRESERLNAIITDFLVYSRDKRYEMRPVNLIALLEDTLTLLEMRLEKIAIVRNFEAKQVYSVGDGDKLKQVFWNICENAVRAMGEAGGKLTVSVGNKNGRWRVTFQDTGHGITPKQMGKMFEPFQSDFEGGTGLGLAIVYQILQAHDATITVQSEPGKGTEFMLDFQKAESPNATADSNAVVRGQMSASAAQVGESGQTRG